MTKQETQAATAGVDALEKALEKLNDLAKSEKDEKNELMAKSMKEELSEEESARLITLLKGGKGEDKTLAKSATANLTPESNSAVAAAVDVSDYLNAFNTGNIGALETLADTIEKSDARNHEVQLAMAKAIVSVGNLVKSLVADVNSWASQEAAPPQGARTPAQAVQQVAQPLNKSMAGAPPAGDVISKGEALELLDSMHQESLKKGMGGRAACGEDLNNAIAKYEMTSKMSKSLIDEMKAYRATKRSA